MPHAARSRLCAVLIASPPLTARPPQRAGLRLQGGPVARLNELIPGILPAAVPLPGTAPVSSPRPRSFTLSGGIGLAKEELLELDGIVDEVLPDSKYRVTLENGVVVGAYASGRMRKNHIRILAGDRVTLELSVYDLTKGRINFRHKDANSPRPPRTGQPRR